MFGSLRIAHGLLLAAFVSDPLLAQDDISKLLEKELQVNRLAGMAVVVRADGAAVIGSAGVKRDGESAAIERGNLFHLGSNTKAFTATMIARLVETGKLSWATTPLDVFPELRATLHPALKDVTLEQLLSHHAGIAPYSDSSEKEYKALPPISGSAVEQRIKFSAWVLQHKPALAPGKKGSYSNAGFVIAAAMAERVTGSSWEELVTAHVLEPLGIHAVYAWPATGDRGQPWGHSETKKGLKAQDPADELEQLPPFLLPAGGMAMSMGDYGKFLQEHLRGLEGKKSSFLSVETIRKLHSSSMMDKYALGWGIAPVDGVPSSSHTGSAGSFYAVVVLQPGRDVAVAVVTNSDGVRSETSAKKVLKALLAQHLSPAR